ncbi:MAG: glutamate--tRNA ligase family protein [Spirochaetota bacterium]
MPRLRTRIAPTPSGHLHIGNIYSFLLTWLMAKRIGMSILLRIDDMDAERSRPEYVDSIFRTLEFAGITWDEGPSGPDDFYRNWGQSCRRHLYDKALETLRDAGTLFACGCSRAALRSSPDGTYPGTYAGRCASACRERGLPFEGDVAWRMRIDADTVSINDHFRGAVTSPFPASMRDVVVRRRDRIPSYQLASVIDDVHFGITHIVRGRDLFDSTCVQVIIGEALSLTAFARTPLIHHPLIAPGGRKLSKSQDAAPVLSAYKDRSLLIRDVLVCAGVNGDHHSLQEMLADADEIIRALSTYPKGVPDSL